MSLDYDGPPIGHHYDHGSLWCAHSTEMRFISSVRKIDDLPSYEYEQAGALFVAKPKEEPVVEPEARTVNMHLPTARQQRIEFLERHRVVIQAHMKTRAEDADWHGVSDDANDLREVDAELRGLRFA